jgi:ppGpp synthetase/RelA/SpoT-type nucleotidyltranferase
MGDDLGPRYETVRSYYDLASKHVRDIINTHTADFKIQDIQYRAKSTKSFVIKTQKYDDEGNLKYTDPFNQITDLAGVRLICFLRQDVDPICNQILRTFDSDGVEDVGERVFQKGRFGYQSKHILVKLPKATYLPACEYVDEVVCEVQVRTLLQHAWAEMEHDIQYKGERVPDALRKRFAALAGLLEIADGEFQRIQDDSDSLRSAVEDDLLSRLTIEGFREERIDGDQSQISESSRSVRDLVAAGELSEALRLFDDKIRREPSSNTLYIGRAKVRFLQGDSSGAISDLEKARQIKANNPAIDNLVKLIEDGDVEYVRRLSLPIASYADRLERAVALMKDGKGEEAFEVFSDLEESGYSKPFSFINKSFCCLLETDSAGAKEFIGKLQVNVGTPMSVNILIAKYFVAIVDDKERAETLNELKVILDAVPHYSVAQSPVFNFFSGLKVRNRPLFNIARKDLGSVPQISFRGL